MISNVKYYSFKELNLTQRMPFRLLVAMIFLFLLIVAEPPVMLFVLTFGYMISGPLTGLIIRFRRYTSKSGRLKE